MEVTLVVKFSPSLTTMLAISTQRLEKNAKEFVSGQGPGRNETFYWAAHAHSPLDLSTRNDQ